MQTFTAARSMMAMSLGFHILLAVAGMAMPVLMVISEALWFIKKDGGYLELTKRWAKGTAILFAVGAVSGTALSFELGLLWPKFMAVAGPVIGLPLSMEMYAFFLEAIALGIYLYGWDAVPPAMHLFSGIVVALSGTASAVFIVTANSWMNYPVGFDMHQGVPINIRPWEAMWNPMAFAQALHMVLAAFAAIGFMVAGIHAWFLLKNQKVSFNQRAFAIALVVGGIPATLQPISGDIAAKAVAAFQPVKLAAMEGHWETQKDAPVILGGIPDEQNEVTRYGIKIPYALSFLATNDIHAEIKGLKDFPRRDRPPVLITHLSFQLMVALGSAMVGVALLGAFVAMRKKQTPWPRWYLRLVLIVSPAGLIATEAGWITTEVGRQPWIAYHLMRSADAVVSVPTLIVPLVFFTALYFTLGIVTISLLRRHVFDGSLPHS